MMQVSWATTLTTELPMTAEQVAHWLVAQRPDLVRRLGTAGTPSTEEVVRFMRLQPHFANMVSSLYAREHDLLPQTAQVLAARPR